MADTKATERTYFAGGSMAAAAADRVILDPETGAPRLENDKSERRRLALILLYYRMGNALCIDWPPGSSNHIQGEDLRRTAARLQAFPTTYYLRSTEAWAWGLFGFAAGPDID